MDTYNDIYLKTRKKLRAAGIEACELEARLIVAHGAGRTREEILGMGKIYATDARVREKIDESVKRRLKGEPVAYVVGEWEFYGIPIIVNSSVLIPRVDTEVLAREAINLINRKGWKTRLLDLCAGSGCVGIAVAANALNCRIVVADVSEAALAVCRANMLNSNLSSRITAVKVDVLRAPPAMLGAFDVIVCNPPYIPTEDLVTLDKSVREYEPVEALDGGLEGLDYFYAVAENWSKLIKPGGNLAFECGAGQAPDVRSIMVKYGFKDIKIFKDTLGIERVLVGRI
jgi:release factor glutamine methyltransferase